MTREAPDGADDYATCRDCGRAFGAAELLETRNAVAERERADVERYLRERLAPAGPWPELALLNPATYAPLVDPDLVRRCPLCGGELGRR